MMMMKMIDTLFSFKTVLILQSSLQKQNNYDPLSCRIIFAFTPSIRVVELVVDAVATTTMHRQECEMRYTEENLTGLGAVFILPIRLS
jgi:hypothetical protein